MSMKNSIDTIGNRTRDFPTCSALPQPIALPRAPVWLSSQPYYELLSFRNKFRIIKRTRCTNFSILFWNKILQVSYSSSAHHQEYFTAHTAMLYVIPVCWQLASRIRMELSSILILLAASYLHICMTHTIAVCAVKYSWWWTEKLFKTCRISFQNKIENLVHLFSFIIRKINWKISTVQLQRHVSLSTALSPNCPKRTVEKKEIWDRTSSSRAAGSLPIPHTLSSCT
jgi:hypothetical protein